ncbi:carbohydrate ABC transporter permease [Amnibacterium kyonggiense]|uniref:Raffinose/stachyose/melibiose transport system permease protein n=1 Tax=Amnibacterium kyonggiense TaxID=595671 RepID=A0A4R7FR93_9MICO|nr:carbohydrate ABC transporter permease [Amnibacterium kyonggiense]TDS80345.1 raffinose/stachyose/melibiose transport system permease protein [Amnibacterium kyonggiense]
MNRTLARITASGVLILLAVIVGLPFYYIVVNTFKSQPQMELNPIALPSSLDLDNYIQVFATSDVGRAFLNTAIVTAVSVALMLAVGSMAAFSLLYRGGRFSTIAGGILLAAFLVPFQSTIIPLYQLVVNAGLADSLQGLIAIYLGGSVFCYFIIVGYMRSVPMEILEAARIDGAGPLRVYWSIVLPLIRPVLITVGVFQIMWVWNDYISPTIFLSSPSNNTLVLLAEQAVAQFTTNWPAFMTVTVIVLIPMLVLFITMQKYIVDGLTSGSVKG